jgi:hypothetical protein
MGIQSREFVEKRIQFLETNAKGGYVSKPQKQNQTSMNKKRSSATYNDGNDVVADGD